MHTEEIKPKLEFQMKTFLMAIFGSMLFCCLCSAEDTVKGEFYFDESGKKVSYRDDNGKELWSFELPEERVRGRGGRRTTAVFTRSNMGRTSVVVDRNFVLLTVGATVYALDLKTGKENWKHPFQRQRGGMGSLSQPVLTKDHILLSVNQAGDSLICVDRKTGKQVWSCLLYTSPSPRDQRGSRMPSSA